MGAFVDRTDTHINGFHIVSMHDRDEMGRPRWKTVCDLCGKVAYRRADQLLAIKGCRCKSKTHGMTRTRAFSVWVGMRNRCFNERDKSYPAYGGRGIAISLSWRMSFLNFYRDMGEPPEGMTLDRIDVNGNY